MMLNKFPKDTDLQSILFYLGEAPKWGARNRALFALRQILRIKDIAGLRVSDVLGPDGYVRAFLMLGDGCIVELGDDVRRELYRYLTSRFGFEQLARPRSRTHDLGLLSLFPTQKRGQFSPNTLAQHFCHLDRHVRQRFTTRRRGA